VVAANHHASACQADHQIRADGHSFVRPKNMPYKDLWLLRVSGRMCSMICAEYRRPRGVHRL